MKSDKPLEVTSLTFDKEVLQADVPVFVDFWAPWCGPCLMMIPILDNLAKDYEGKLKVVKLNVDLPEHRGLSIKYEIQGIPNMKIFYQGKVVQDLVGFRPQERLYFEVDTVLTKFQDQESK